MNVKYNTRKQKKRTQKKTKGGNRARKTVAEILRNSGAFGNVPKTKKEKRKQLILIDKMIAKDNKEQYNAENAEEKAND